MLKKDGKRWEPWNLKDPVLQGAFPVRFPVCAVLSSPEAAVAASILPDAFIHKRISGYPHFCSDSQKYITKSKNISQLTNGVPKSKPASLQRLSCCVRSPAASGCHCQSADLSVSGASCLQETKTPDLTEDVHPGRSDSS